MMQWGSSSTDFDISLGDVTSGRVGFPGITVNGGAGVLGIIFG